MDIQAIVLDIDGTLLTSDRKITKKTKEALLTAQEAGIKLLLASGRSTFGLVPFAKELNMQKYGGLLIANNGAMVTDASGNKMHLNETIHQTPVKSLIQHIQYFDAHVMLMDHKKLHTMNVEQAVIETEKGPLNVVIAESEDCGLEIVEHAHLNDFNEPVTKITIAAKPTKLSEMSKELMAPIEQEVSHAFTSPHFIEIMKKGVDKAYGLDAALETLGISNKQAIAFCDGENDLPLIQHAGIGVAMGNATENVKKHADLITHTNDNDGIAEVLKTHIL